MRHRQRSEDIRVMMGRHEASDPNSSPMGKNLPGPSNSHSSPATTLSPLLSSKSSNAFRWSAVLGRTTCSGVMS